MQLERRHRMAAADRSALLVMVRDSPLDMKRARARGRGARLRGRSQRQDEMDDDVEAPPGGASVREAGGKLGELLEDDPTVGIEDVEAIPVMVHAVITGDGH